VFRSVCDYCAYLAVRTVICLVQALPLEVLEVYSRRLGWFFWKFVRVRRKVIKENLKIAFPEKKETERDQLALEMWCHLFLMMAEIAHAPRKLRRTNWRRHSSIPRMKEMLRVLIDERPTIVISGHLGNFELGGYLLALHGFPSHTIARPLDNVYLDRYVNRFRGSTGQHILPKQGSGAQIAELLDAGGTLVLLGDQSAGKSGRWVDFFGRPASTHKAVAVFSLGSSAPTAVCAALRQGGPLEMRLELAEIIDPLAEDFELGTIPLFTQWYTENLEKLIRTCPQQYWWVHRRWKGKPTDRRALRRMKKEKQAARC